MNRLDCPPYAEVMKDRMKTHGKYNTPGNSPRGAIVHFTSGRDGAQKTIRGGIKNGYAFWCIQEDGALYCAHARTEWGYHAGQSSWPGLVDRVSDDLIGIEINNAGKVAKMPDGNFQTWFKTTLLPDDVRFIEKQTANQERGYYHKFTVMQEDTLIQTLIWLKLQAPDVFSFDRVLGHDEVSPGRKNDPGGSLSMTMPEFREQLKRLYVLQTTGV